MGTPRPPACRASCESTFTTARVCLQPSCVGCVARAICAPLSKLSLPTPPGYVCGPKHGKRLELFIDDLHLPLRHTTSPEHCVPHEVSSGFAHLCRDRHQLPVSDHRCRNHGGNGGSCPHKICSTGAFNLAAHCFSIG